nr:voltage-dependent calcium channel subunit alpha-2/delta-3-like [Parasteatoda tepidariorum]
MNVCFNNVLVLIIVGFFCKNLYLTNRKVVPLISVIKKLGYFFVNKFIILMKCCSFQPLQLMTTVATPVFDKRNIKSASLLGVAGTDIPIREITKLTRADKIGVNAYSFAITNNEHVLFHPELRPLVTFFQCYLISLVY